jgi:hypothetical protein
MTLNAKISFAFAKDQKTTANVLFLVAVLQLLLGGIYGWFYWGSLEHSYWQGWVFVFSAPIYLTLGLAVRWIKHYSLLVGFALYVYLAFTVHPVPYASSGTWQDGLFLKLPILTFLLWGLLASVDQRQSKRQWETVLIAILVVLCGYGVQFAIYGMIGLNDWVGSVEASLRGTASSLAKGTRMAEIVDIFCEANSKFIRMSIVDGCILGVCGLGLCLMLIKLMSRVMRRKSQSNDSNTF